MPKYVDGFLLPAPIDELDAYRKIAQKAGKIWMKHGALAYYECVADDLEAPNLTPFPKRVKPKPGETIIFSFIIFKSRAHRDRVNKKVMKDPGMLTPPEAEPFDMKRMSYGGFNVLVGLEA